MKKLKKFEKWFLKLGGDINNLDVALIFDKLNNQHLQIGWLKQN